MSFLIQNFIKMTDGIDLLFVENYCPTVWKKKMRIRFSLQTNIQMSFKGYSRGSDISPQFILIGKIYLNRCVKDQSLASSWVSSVPQANTTYYWKHQYWSIPEALLLGSSSHIHFTEANLPFLIHLTEQSLNSLCQTISREWIFFPSNTLQKAN